MDQVQKFRKRMMVGKFGLNNLNRMSTTVPDAEKILWPQAKLKTSRVFEKLVRRRVSSRAFKNKTFRPENLRALLETSTAAAVSKAGDIDCFDLALWIRRVAGIPDGFYIYDASESCLRATKPLSKKPWSEDYIPDHSRVLLCIRARPEKLISAYGQRGWRFLWMTAGSCWAHLYLASADLKVGCCGVGGSPEEMGRGKAEQGIISPIAFIVFGQI